MPYGYKTILELDGKTIDVTVCSYSFEKEIDENGDVTSPAIGGTIYLSLTDIPEDNILEWGIKHRKYKTGRINVLSQDGETALAEEEIAFENAACVNLKLSYERDHNDYFTTLLTISAESICVGQNGCWINKDWKL